MTNAYLSLVESVLVALAVGVCLGFSIRKQHRLWKLGQTDVSSSSAFERVSYAGLSLAIIFGAIVIARTLSSLDRYHFMGVFFLGAIVTLLATMRSNRTIERDARKDTARPSS